MKYFEYVKLKIIKLLLKLQKESIQTDPEFKIVLKYILVQISVCEFSNSLKLLKNL